MLDASFHFILSIIIHILILKYNIKFKKKIKYSNFFLIDKFLTGKNLKKTIQY